MIKMTHELFKINYVLLKAFKLKYFNCVNSRINYQDF